MTTNSLMASAISTSSFTIKRHSFTAISVPHYPKVQFLKLIPFSSWNGLKQLTISKAKYSLQIGRSRKFKGKGVYASLFGVGAPEALVIGVVALLVFGPKGLAEVARNLGKTLREFQPTIRELQEVSNEFKSTLEREIGLDDIKGSSQDRNNSSTTSKTVSPSSITSSNDSIQEADPNGSPSPIIESSGEDDMEKLLRIAEAEKQAERDLETLLQSRSDSRTVSQEADNSSSSGRAYSTEEYLKITEEQLKSAAQQQNEASTPEQSPFNAQSQSQDGPYSSEELSKITEQQQNETSSPQQSLSVGQSESQVTPAQAASAIPSPQKPESET